MENLLPIVDNSNPLNIRVGNPGLKPSFAHTMRLFYNTYNAEKQRGIMTHVNFTATQNSISNSTIYDENTGGTTSILRISMETGMRLVCSVLIRL